MAGITSSIDLLHLIKTSWHHWIIFIKENLILFFCIFCFNIQLNNCLQLQERFSILLVALEILRYIHTYVHTYVHSNTYQLLKSHKLFIFVFGGPLLILGHLLLISCSKPNVTSNQTLNMMIFLT